MQRTSLAAALLRAALLGASASAAHAQVAVRGKTPRDSTGQPLRVPELEPGNVLSETKISNAEGALSDLLDTYDYFGRTVAQAGDVDGDGNVDLAVTSGGTLWILFLEGDGSVRSHREIRLLEEGFLGTLPYHPALAALGDLDGDGTPDLALGVFLDDDAGENVGAVWIVFLAPDGSVRARQKITSSQGGFPPLLLDPGDVFGISLALIGDLDGDGVGELAAGATGDDDGCFSCQNAGAVWILFLDPDGTVHGQTKISGGGPGSGLFLQPQGNFGSDVAELGDLDGDGLFELAVGASGDDDGFFNAGAVYVVFIDALGGVRAGQKISELEGGFVGDDTMYRAVAADALAAPGDIDGDGVPDLFVGSASLEHAGGFWVLALHPDGTVKTQGAVHQGAGGFTEDYLDDSFGDALAMLDDLDGNGVRDLAVGAPSGGVDPTFGSFHGAVWILGLGAGAQVVSDLLITPGSGGLPEDTLDRDDHFGLAVTSLGDLDGDGHAEVAVGAPFDDDGGWDHGAVWLLSLGAGDELLAHAKISDRLGGFTGLLDSDRFGTALAFLGDLDGDGTIELAVGAPRADDGGADRGAVWVLSLLPDMTVARHQKISSTSGGLVANLVRGEGFGSALAPLGDLDGDGVSDLAVSSPGIDQTIGTGRCWILFLRPDATVRSTREIGPSAGGFGGTLDLGDHFGFSLAALEDLDGDGVVELAVGAARDDDGASNSGALWLLFLRPDGSVRIHRKIGEGAGGFPGDLEAEEMFASACAGPGDLDGDGLPDLAVGAPGHDAFNHGAVWILFLRADGTVRAHGKIGAAAGGFGGTLDAGDRFGGALSAELDLDGDGVRDLLVGAPNDDDDDRDKGALWLLRIAGIANLDFERADDLERSPLANGRSLTGAGAFARTVALAGLGANLGPAIFDSTPLGPNDPSQDRDLLVGRGNLLLLQNSLAPTQTVAGIFDRPNDDQDGGRLDFRFPAPAAPLSLVLVDIDPGSGQQASVRLFDAAGRLRTYSIPAGWTEDLLVHGPPGWRTLALTTLDAQPGYLASATAAESPGFRADQVVRLEVELGSSGAVDDLRFDPHPVGE